MSLRIYTIDEPEVREHSQEITPAELASPELQKFADQLIDMMIQCDGIGIASCQVGRTIRMIVVAKEYTDDGNHLVLVNPRIVSVSKKTSRMEEGCLSVPALFGPVERPTKIRVKALNRAGEPVDIKAKGMLARILQHEVDHVNGILFVDKAARLRQRGSDVYLSE